MFQYLATVAQALLLIWTDIIHSESTKLINSTRNFLYTVYHLKEYVNLSTVTSESTSFYILSLTYFMFFTYCLPLSS